MRRGFTPRAGRPRPALTWVDVSQQWNINVSATGTATLIMLQAPASLAALTSDPPEDMTVLRVVGDFLVSIGTGLGNWTLGLLVADVTWTPAATFTLDADKRILWHQTYESTTSGAFTWQPPDTLLVTIAGGTSVSQTKGAHIDITPKVRIEPGKALYLVAWENTGALQFTTLSQDMRVLFKRSGRR